MRTLPDDLERRVFTVEEAAEIIGIGRASMYGAIKRHEVDAVKIGRRLVVPGIAIARLLGGATSANGSGTPVEAIGSLVESSGDGRSSHGNDPPVPR